jgi:redox-sensing transcriptional repressor
MLSRSERRVIFAGFCLETWKHYASCGLKRKPLGAAIAEYPGFVEQGFHIVAAFDKSPEVIGHSAGGVRVEPMKELEKTILTRGIRLAIVAVPREEAQEVISRLVGCGIRAILNYAPIEAHVPPCVRVKNIDPVAALQSTTFYLRNA